MIDQALSTARRRLTTPYKRHRLSGHYEHILSQLHCPGQSNGAPRRGIGIVGLTHGDGASTVSANLAIAASRAGMDSVLLIDANPLRPALHGLFEIAPAPGFSEWMSDILDPLECVHASSVPGLSVMPWGEVSDRTVMMMEPAALVEKFDSLSENYGLILFDLPAAGETGLGVNLARSLSGVVLVLEAESSRQRAAIRAKHQLENAGVNILGVVLNKHRRHLPNWLYRAL
jgi:Mrp family chromosome partitioning ATPase